MNKRNPRRAEILRRIKSLGSSKSLQNYIRPRTKGAKLSVPKLDTAAAIAQEHFKSLDWLGGLSEQQEPIVEFHGVSLAAELRTHMRARLVEARGRQEALVDAFLPAEDEILSEVERHLMHLVDAMAYASRQHLATELGNLGLLRARDAVRRMKQTAREDSVTAGSSVLMGDPRFSATVKKHQAKEVTKEFVEKLRGPAAKHRGGSDPSAPR